MPKLPNFTLSIGLVVLFSISGCAAGGANVLTGPDISPKDGIVFVADGAGDFRAASTALRLAVTDDRCPLQVETFVWSHGYCRLLRDQLDHAHARAKGKTLATEIAAYHVDHPQQRIYLMGHCAGSRVVLSAAEDLPPGSVSRIVLLAPSVPATYDLRPALRSTTEGIDAFCSDRDHIYLGLGMRLLSFLGGGSYPASGYTGFEFVGTSVGDALLYSKLRQYPWQPCLAWTGNDGGHYGGYQQGFLRALVLPMFAHHVEVPIDLGTHIID